MKSISLLLLFLVFLSCESVEVQITEETNEIKFSENQEELTMADELPIETCTKESKEESPYTNGILVKIVEDSTPIYNGSYTPHYEHEYHYGLQLDSRRIIQIETNDLVESLPLNEPLRLDLRKNRAQNEKYIVVSDMTNVYENKDCEKDDSLAVLEAISNKNASITNDEDLKIYLIRDSQNFSLEPKTSAARKIESFYNNVGGGKFSTEVTDFKMPLNINSQACVQQGGGCLLAWREEAEAIFTQNNIPYSNNTKFVFRGGAPTDGIAGLGFIGGNASVVFVAGDHTLLHEIGHNMGWGHASGFSPDGNHGEYSDNTSIMGFATVRPNALQLHQAQLLSPNQVISLNQTSQVILAPIEYNPMAVSYVKQLATISASNGTYYVSTREENLPWNYIGLSNHVYLHKAGSQAKTHLIKGIVEGESLVHDGLKIEFLEKSGSFYRVNIYKNVDDSPPTNLDFPETPQASCVGQIPPLANLCEGDNQGLNQNIERVLSSSCTSARKCEYTCPTGLRLDDDQTTCIPEDNSGVSYYCDGEITVPNSLMCPGDAQNLTEVLTPKLVSQCTSQRKCEYTCQPGYNLQLSSFSPPTCVEDPNATPSPSINISSQGYNGSPEDSFTLWEDQVFFKVTHMPANAKACWEQQIDGEGAGNLGYCENLPANSNDWHAVSPDGEWSYQQNEWRLYHNLIQGQYYWRPGLYRMYWLNPNNNERVSYEFRME